MIHRHTSDTGQPSFPDRERWLLPHEGDPFESDVTSGDGGAPGDGALSVVLAYPERYAIGMSNLGVHAALRAFRGAPGVRCERAFWPHSSAVVEYDGFAGVAPGSDLARHLPEGAGLSLESGTALSEFDIIAFSVSFEGDYFNLVRMLAAGGVDPMSAGRGDEGPLVVVGGVCAHINPAPTAPFVDAFLIGDADALVAPFIAALAGEGGPRAEAGLPDAPGRRGESRRERLKRIAGLPGVYVPSMPRAEPVAPAPWAGRWVDSVVVSSETYFKDMFLTEISRGCGRGCRFCAAGEIHRPVRFRPADEVIASVQHALGETRRIGLVSAALGDHPEIVEILEAMRSLEVELNISSLRMEAVTPRVAELLAACGVRTATIAPEVGAEKLRSRIGKRIDDDGIIAASELLASHGIRRVRAYFMTGLPGVEPGEAEAVAALCERIQKAVQPHGARLSVSISPFVPKPRTPLQWAAMAPEGEHRRTIGEIRRALARIGVQVTNARPREATREAALARGGAELADAIRLAALEGVPWKAAARRSGVDLDAIVHREREAGEVFPWEVVDVGRDRDTLRRAYESF